jgi:single-strand DNA-binding protein
MNLNHIFFAGNLTRDPALSYLPNTQTAVCEFGIASTRTFYKQDKTKGEETCFVDCQIFGKRADVINKYFKKGDPIFVEGRLKLDQWTAQDGSKKSRLRVMVENFEFVGSPKKDEPAADEPQNNKPKFKEYDPDNPDGIPY